MTSSKCAKEFGLYKRNVGSNLSVVVRIADG